MHARSFARSFVCLFCGLCFLFGRLWCLLFLRGAVQGMRVLSVGGFVELRLFPLSTFAFVFVSMCCGCCYVVAWSVLF